jgi:hypothetical protein
LRHHRRAGERYCSEQHRGNRQGLLHLAPPGWGCR